MCYVSRQLHQLPLLWNVFRGDMNLVGPWPCRPDEVEAFGADARFAFRPGIVGPEILLTSAQNGPARWQDAEDTYIRDWTPALDLRIIARTVALAFQNPSER